MRLIELHMLRMCIIFLCFPLILILNKHKLFYWFLNSGRLLLTEVSIQKRIWSRKFLVQSICEWPSTESNQVENARKYIEIKSKSKVNCGEQCPSNGLQRANAHRDDQRPDDRPIGHHQTRKRNWEALQTLESSDSN